VPVTVKLPKGTKVTAISAGGYYFSLALSSTGSVLAWGYNGDGELGNGTTTQSNVPVKTKLPKGTKATEIAAGAQHAVALTSRGAVLAWGSNGDGQLGNGTTTQSDVPVKVKLPKDTAATQVAAGGFSYHTLALIHRA
jgi:alpha-tubulin suppressor-like RCC1 family protein